MFPILLSWRGVRIYSYPAMVYLGMVGGLVTTNYYANLTTLDSRHVLEAMLILVVIGLIGARLLHVLIHLDFYRCYPNRIWHRRGGGASQLGGLLLMLVMSVPLLRIMEMSWLRFWDIGVFGLFITLALGKIGCLFHGCCCGRPSDTWLTVPLPDHRGLWTPRLPSQILESGVAVLIVGLAVLLWHQHLYPGTVFLACTLVYMVARFPLQMTRADQDKIGAINVQYMLLSLLAIGSLVGLLFLHLQA